MKMPKNSYQHLFQNMKNAVYLVAIDSAGKDGKFIDFNKAALQLLGYSTKEMESISVLDIIPKKLHATYPLFKKLTKGSDFKLFNTKHLTKEGKEVSLEIENHFFKHDGNELVWSILREIPKEEKLITSLNNEVEVAKQYFNLAGVIFVSMDLDGKIQDMNHVGCNILGYETQFVNGKLELKENGFTTIEGLDWFENFIPEENRARLRKLHFEAIKHQSLADEYYINEVLCKDGSRKMISWHNAFLKNEQGEITGSLSSGMDISMRINAENEILKEKERTEKVMMDALLSGQEKERHRIAADLHDSIQPLLSTIKRKVESFSAYTKELPKEKKNEYLQISKLLNQALVEIKAISYNLVPPTLKEFGLINTLQDLCENMDLAGKATVQFISTNTSNGFGRELEIGLYRIAQELLTNSLKHSEADHIILQLIGHDNSVMLIVEDDGIGFDNNTRKAGLGMKNIESRVKALDGRLDIDATKGKGCTIIVEIPIINN